MVDSGPCDVEPKQFLNIPTVSSLQSLRTIVLSHIFEFNGNCVEFIIFFLSSLTFLSGINQIYTHIIKTKKSFSVLSPVIYHIVDHYIYSVSYLPVAI